MDKVEWINLILVGDYPDCYNATVRLRPSWVLGTVAGD